METSIGVFGEELLLWLCMLRQSPRRPPADHVLRQANLLLEELKGSKLALSLPVASVDDGMFAIAAFADELAMSLPDLRPVWAQRPLQASRWMTNNAGVELFERLGRVQSGPLPVMATYACVLGLGFRGRYGLPGQNSDDLLRIRRDLSLKLGVDPDRDWKAGVLRPAIVDGVAAQHVPGLPLWRSALVGRTLAALVAIAGALALGWTIAQKVG
ncbi:DotU family type IV/VI secretion system protein [Sorangium sp. So ce1153]|uniref:DotU family type IV/VI secretion system protein n=1 Tax=Sorangium sp. So ce1153 TaxID=3133333 RepID=UPI003F5EE735